MGGHCFLENKETGDILDITEDQYGKQNISIPYQLGIPGGFRTKDFSKSARVLAEKSGLIDTQE